MTNYTYQDSRVKLCTTRLENLTDENNVIEYGAIILCRHGSADIRIDFKDWHLNEGAVITLFPNDMVCVNNVSSDFEADMLSYDKHMLREASLQLEQTVYSLLRKDRCRTGTPIVTEIIDGMFNLLRAYLKQHECNCLEQLVLYQLKAFFLGFYDHICRTQKENRPDNESSRTNELFNMFMEQLETCYKESHDVAYYAERLNITPKYLNSIVQRVTHMTPKTIIDNYVILQIKLVLRTCDANVKQISWDFNFSDPSFFCRYFKQHTGLTPQQFRKSMKESL